MTLPELNTPVAFIIFNRPKATQIVFEAIRRAKPSKLFVIADGARLERPDETEACAKVRSVIKQIDWDCNLLTDYSEKNLGCKKRVSSGLDWVFSQTESAIILEDDCVPHPTFFEYCQELLNYHQHDERITSICGLNVQFDHKRTENSYYFSRYSHIWGWATWRRVWQQYDVDIKLWPDIRDNGYLEYLFKDSRAVKYWTEIFQATYDGKIDTWDYQWIFNCLVQGGLNAIPKRNLISNIGFGNDATHTVNSTESTQYANMQTEAMSFPLSHPSSFIAHLTADQFTQTSYYDYDMRTWSRVRRKIKSLLCR